jgi:hypothetical protein
MAGLEDPSMRAVYLRGLFDSCLRDLMGDQDEPALEIETGEIPDAAEQMYIHFMANAESNGLRIEPQPSWQIFNKEDPSTWPSEGQKCWVYTADNREPIQPTQFSGGDWWNSEYFTVRFWMPIELPQPPESTS